MFEDLFAPFAPPARAYAPADQAALLQYYRAGERPRVYPAAVPAWMTTRYLARTRAERFFARINVAAGGCRLVPGYAGR